MIESLAVGTEAATLERRALTYRDWPAEKKAEAIAAYEVNGSLKQTARLLDIPPETLRYWIQSSERYQNEFRPEQTLELTTKLESNAHKLADSIAEHDLSIVPLQAKATALGITIDKMQLLKGLPTSITETVNKAEIIQALQFALSAEIDVTPEQSTD